MFIRLSESFTVNYIFDFYIATYQFAKNQCFAKQNKLVTSLCVLPSRYSFRPTHGAKSIPLNKLKAKGTVSSYRVHF